MIKVLDFTPILRNHLINLICAPQSTRLLFVVIIALLKGGFNLAFIGGDDGLHFRLHGSDNLLDGFLDLL